MAACVAFRSIRYSRTKTDRLGLIWRGFDLLSGLAMVVASDFHNFRSKRTLPHRIFFRNTEDVAEILQ
jgi:hypothetical protein